MTVTEKQHWKDRIAKRIDKRIDAICAEEPEFMERLNQAARQEALETLGIADLQHCLERIERQERLLDARRDKARREMIAKIRGISVREAAKASFYGMEQDISEAVERRKAVHEQELLGHTARGREILALRREKEELLDTVWLATSPQQIKDLWRKVDEMLGGDQTELQREALAIEPLEESR